jgi:glutamate--cysteine ligase
VPVAVATALLDDEEASATASRALAGCADLWTDARHGLGDPRLATAARTAFTLALDALPRLGAAPATVDLVARFADRYAGRSRCPADDLLDAWARDGSLLPADPALAYERRENGRPAERAPARRAAMGVERSPTGDTVSWT